MCMKCIDLSESIVNRLLEFIRVGSNKTWSDNSIRAAKISQSGNANAMNHMEVASKEKQIQVQEKLRVIDWDLVLLGCKSILPSFGTLPSGAS